MDEQQWIEAGLLDPAFPRRQDRLELLRWLTDRGITLQQMVARGERSLLEFASDLNVRPGPRITAREIASRTGVETDDVVALSLIAGLTPCLPDEPAFTESDLTLFRAYSAGSGLFGEGPTRRFVRVVGSSLSRVAEAAVALYQFQVAVPALESGGSELNVALKAIRAVENLDGVREVLDGLFSSHVEIAIRRLREARRTGSPQTPFFAVGFIDLVGFTALTEKMPAAELDRLLERFEETAHDIVSGHDGRVVKLIGDEVMFVTREPLAACRICLALLERFANDAAVTPRGGVTYGRTLIRGGDYYGPVVNLASRIAQVARPNEILVDSDVTLSATDSGMTFEPAGRRRLKGFGKPRNVWRLIPPGR